VNYNVSLFIEGFYDQYLNQAAVLDPVGSPTVCDSIYLELHSPSQLSVASYTLPGLLHTNGSASFAVPAAAANQSWYLVIRHRNALETWSASPVTLVENGNYNFYSAASQAYGNNQADLGSGVFGLYSGDLNQDGMIETSDYSQMENDILLFLFGYYVSDLTGDGQVETSDYSLMENNILKFIFVAKPF
jgi:hypothetical protein